MVATGTDRILRIDTGGGDGPRVWTDLPGKYVGLGGRAMASQLVCSEVPPDCHPLDAENKLVLAPGFMSGTTALSGNLFIGSKTPLSDYLAVATSRGGAAEALARLGYAAVVIEGKPRSDALHTIHISPDRVEVLPADHERGTTCRELASRLPGPEVSVIGIGPAGERRMLAAVATVCDAGGAPSRRFGRGGDGAVMGAKGIKAIVVDARNSDPRKPAKPKLFRAAWKRFLEHMGPAADGASLPDFPECPNCGGKPCPDLTAENTPARNAGHTSSRILRPAVDVAWAFGQVTGLDAPGIERLEIMCEEYGLDPVETGMTLRVAVQAGLLGRGDTARALELVREAGEGTVMGQMLGSGAAVAAACLGVAHIAQDDHARLEKELLDQLTGGNGRAELTCRLLVVSMALEMVGYCPYMALSVLKRPGSFQAVIDAINAVYGLSMTHDDMMRLSEGTLRNEREFNARVAKAREADQYRLHPPANLLGPFGALFDNTGPARECSYEL